VALALALPSVGCMALTPQLPPTDFAELEQVSDRGEREQLYAENVIVKHDEPQGARYTKGENPMASKRSWQSLDAVLRSDATASAALPKRKLRLSRIFTALTVASGILTIAGAAASAREGLDLQELNGTGGLLLGAGIATVAFGITSGVLYGKSRKDYERAVDIYNDSLGMRLGLNTASGAYIPPAGTIVDEDGFVVLDSGETPGEPAPEEATVEPPPEPTPEPAPEPEPAAPASPAATDVADSPAEPEPAAPPAASEPEPQPSVVPPSEASAPPPAAVPAPPGGGTAAPPLSLSPRQ